MSDYAEIPPATSRVSVSLFGPLIIALLIGSVATNLGGSTSNVYASRSIVFAGIGVVSWLLGQRWYGRPGMGLRGKRPMFAGSGFAFLGWVAVLIVRIWYIETIEDQTGASRLADDFFYLLLFEAFAVQLWTFGLFFRSVADWRGPLTAAISSGIVFATVGYLFFVESTYDPNASMSAYLYFLAWGIFYGIVRLRTGSIVGIVIVQAMQSLTAWHLLPPQVPPTQPETFNWFYLWMGVAYLILIWRLWPKEESDYRV